MENVAVLGASNKPDRYSFMAIEQLLKHNHKVFPINPVLKEISGITVYKDLNDLPKTIDTLTIYVNPTILEKILSDIVKLNPKRVIFNPGTESKNLMERLEKENIKVIKGCTLVMLKTDQF